MVQAPGWCIYYSNNICTYGVWEKLVHYLETPNTIQCLVHCVQTSVTTIDVQYFFYWHHSPELIQPASVALRVEPWMAFQLQMHADRDSFTKFSKVLPKLSGKN